MSSSLKSNIHCVIKHRSSAEPLCSIVFTSIRPSRTNETPPAQAFQNQQRKSAFIYIAFRQLQPCRSVNNFDRAKAGQHPGARGSSLNTHLPPYPDSIRRRNSSVLSAIQLFHTMLIDRPACCPMAHEQAHHPQYLSPLLA